MREHLDCKRHILLMVIFVLCSTILSHAQTTAFTYQGKLVDSGNPANGQYDFQFKLFDTVTLGTGTQQGSTAMVTNTTVAAGIFSVQLDFGACTACFDGSPRFLEIAVRPNGGGSFTTLGPRQPFTSTPYAIRSTNASQLEGHPASGFIQNSITQQAGTNFNIGGNGTAGGTLSAATVNASTQYSIAGLRVLAVNGPFNNGFTNFTASNTFAGDGAGLNTTPDPSLGSDLGKFNSFFGAGAGQGNTGGLFNAFFGTGAGFRNSTGGADSFFGALAGENNTTGGDNAFFGTFAGNNNATGGADSFFGAHAGGGNTTGAGNAFFGMGAGINNSTGDNNAFFGTTAGNSNSTGNNNAFFGEFAGERNSTGSGNAFFGANARFTATNTTGNNNTLLGSSSTVTTNLSNQTAIGALALVTQSNSLVLGSINGLNNATADTNVGIGTTAPLTRLDVVNTGTQIHFGDTTADSGGYLVSTISSQAALSGGAKFDGTNWISKSGGASQIDNISGTTRFFTDAGLTAGSSFTPSERMRITSAGNVGIGTASPVDLLHVAGDIRVGTGTTGCVKDANGTIIAGACSSDARLKREITPFPKLLDKLVQLQPVHFYWRAEQFPDRHFGSSLSFGLIAQEVEQVMPELVTEDDQGFKAVNYSKLPLLTVQAVKELKAENDMLKQKMNEQQTEIVTLKKQVAQIESLKRVVCQSAPNADLCRP